MLLCEVYGANHHAAAMPQQYFQDIVDMANADGSEYRMSLWTRGLLYPCVTVSTSSSP